MNVNRRVRLFDRKMILLLSSHFLIALLTVISLVYFLGDSRRKNINQDFYRDIGNQLQGAGVIDQAIVNYQKYLDGSQLDSNTRAKIAFNIAQLFEDSGRLEDALSWYYYVEVVDANSQDIGESKKRVVAILDKLQKYSAAKFALSQNTSLDKIEQKKGGVIVAKVDGRAIYRYQLDESLDSLPEDLKKQFSSKDGRKKYLQKYIADELFLIKAQRRQYQKDPEILKQLSQIERQLLIQKVMSEEVGSKITVNETDLKNYFVANQSRYSDKKNKAKYESVKQQVELDYKMEKAQNLFSQAVADIMKTEKVELFFESL